MNRREHDLAHGKWRTRPCPTCGDINPRMSEYLTLAEEPAEAPLEAVQRHWGLFSWSRADRFCVPDPYYAFLGGLLLGGCIVAGLVAWALVL